MIADGGKHQKTQGDGGGQLGTAGTTEKDRERQGAVGDNTMSSVLVLGSYSLGKFQK